MSNEMFTQLPSVTNAQLTDIFCAVQGYVSPSSPGTSVQETLQQVFTLMLSNTILNNAGNPNTVLAGTIYQLCWDKTNNILYVCTSTGSSVTAVWTQVAASAATVTNPAHGGTGVASPAAHSLPVAEGSSNFNFLTLTNGQLLIGSTGVDPVPANITAGTNISVTNSAGGITISATGSGGFSWTHVTGTSQAMTANNGYIADNAGLVTLSLPATSNIGDELIIVGRGSGGWSISQAASQQIIIGSSSSTAGVGGSISSTNSKDSIYLVCTNTNLEWTAATGAQGNITVV